MSINFCNLPSWYIRNNQSNTLPSQNSTIDLSSLSGIVIQQADWSALNRCLIKHPIYKNLQGVSSVIGKHITFNSGIFHMGSINCSSGLALTNSAIITAQGPPLPNIHIKLTDVNDKVFNESELLISYIPDSFQLVLTSGSSIRPFQSPGVTGIGTISASTILVNNADINQNLNISSDLIVFENSSKNSAKIDAVSFFLNSTNFGSINQKTLFFNSTNGSKGSIAGSSATMASSTNNGIITASQTRMTTQSINMGRIKSETTFEENAVNRGVCSGTTYFFASYNEGVTTGNILFSSGINRTTGRALGNMIRFEAGSNLGYISGNSIGLSAGTLNDSQGLMICNDIYLIQSNNSGTIRSNNASLSSGSINNGTINSSAIVFNLSTNNNACFGITTLNSGSINNGQLVGTGIFNSNAINNANIDTQNLLFQNNSINHGSISWPDSGVLVFKNKAKNLGDIDYGNFQNNTINNAYIWLTGIFQDFSQNISFAITNGKFYDQSINSGEIENIGLFFGTSTNFGNVSRGSFYNSSKNFGDSNTIADFYDMSRNYGNLHFANFYSQSINFGTINDTAKFSGNAINNSPSILNTVFFGASSINNYDGVCQGTFSFFLDNSINKGTTNSFYTLFIDDSFNHRSGIVNNLGITTFDSTINYGTINNGATFSNTAYNYGTVNGNGLMTYFNNSSINFGTVNGDAVFDSTSCNNGIVNGSCFGCGCP